MIDPKKQPIMDADLHFLKGRLINPITGSAYTTGTIRQIHYGNRKNEFVEKVLEQYFTVLKPQFLKQISQLSTDVLTETINKQK